MSFYDDYVVDGLCCQSCGGFIGDGQGYPRFCHGCDPERAKPKQPKAKRKGKSA